MPGRRRASGTGTGARALRYGALGLIGLALVALAGSQGDLGTGHGRCLICHVDLVEQLEAGPHGEAGAKLECETCHGESEGHVRDEHNEVKPDRVFGAEDEAGLAALVDLCGGCHGEVATAYREATSQAKKREPPLPTCTGCHGSHRTARVRFPHGAAGETPQGR